MIFYAQGIFFNTLLLMCVKYDLNPFDSEFTSSCIMSPLCEVCDIWMPSSKETTRAGTFSGRSTALFCMEMPRAAPPLLGSKPAHRSILTTIEIEIDLRYLGPVAIRSHLLSLPYWKGKHSWCYRTKCSLLGCSVGAVCLVLPPMMDGVNSGYPFTPAHPTCSSVGGGRRSFCL